MKKEKWITKENTFKIGKVQPKDVAQFLLDFLPVSVWCCLQKCCFYKKACMRFYKTPGKSSNHKVFESLKLYMRS